MIIVKKIAIIVISIVLICLISFVAIYDSVGNTCVLKINGVEYNSEDFVKYLTLLEIEQGTEVKPSDIYDQYVNMKIFNQKAKENNVALTEDEVKSLVDNYNSEDFDKQKFLDAGINEEEYMKYYKEAMLASKFINAAGEYYPMAEADYLASREQYVDQMKMYNYRILQVNKANTPAEGEEAKITEESKQAAKTKIEDALNRIKAGEEFETVSGEIGTYRFVSTINGGYSLVNGQIESWPLLYISEAMTNVDLFTELIKLNAGEYTSIIEDEDTYMFAKLETIEETPSEEAENRLKKDLNNLYAQQYILGSTEIIRNMSKIKNNDYTPVASNTTNNDEETKTEDNNQETTETNTEEVADDTNTENVEG